MGGAERVGGFLHDSADLLDRERTPTADPGGERFAVHVAHDEIDQILAFTDRVDRYDMRVRQPGRGLGLPGKSLPDVLLEGQLGGKHFDGNPPLEPFVPGAIDHSHPSPPDLTLDGVGVAQGIGQADCQRSVARRRHGVGAGGVWKAGFPSMANNLYRRESGVESRKSFRHNGSTPSGSSRKGGTQPSERRTGTYRDAKSF